MGTRDFDVKKLLNDRKFWFASFLIAWAAALQVLISIDTIRSLETRIIDFLDIGAYDVYSEARYIQAEVWNPR